MSVISTKNILKVSWEHTKAHFWFLWGLIIILGVVNIVLSILLETYDENVVAMIVLTIAQIMLGVMLQIGMYRILLDLSAGKTVEYKQLIGNSPYFIRFFVTSILYGLIVMVGLILLIVPGIIWSIKYSQWPYLLLEKNMGIMESLRRSGEITYGSKADIFIVSLALMGIIILSVIPLGLGLIATIPLSMLVPVFIYRRLTEEVAPAPVAPLGAPEAPAPFKPLEG